MAVAVLIASLVYFVAWPIVAVLRRGLWVDGSLHIGPVADVVRSGRNRRIIGFTVWQATISTAISVLIGVPLTYLLERRRPWGASLVRTLVLVPFALPTVVVGAAFIALFGVGGPLGSWGLAQSTIIIVLAHVYFNVAVVVRVVGARWRLLDDRPTMAARVLGSNRWQSWKATTIPALRGVVVSAAAIVWLFCLTSFGVIVILGGPRRITIETEIYRLTTQELALDRASGWVLVQLAAVLVTLWIANRAVRPSQALTVRHADSFVGKGRIARTLDLVALLTVSVVVVTPLVFVVERALRDDLLGVRTLGRASGFGWRPIDSVKQSAQFAMWATAIALVLGVAIALARSRRWPGVGVLTPLSVLPIGISAVTLGFGFLIALDRPFDIRAHWQLVPIAQALVALPIVLRTLTPVFDGISLSTREAATMLGASPARVARHIDLAVALGAIATAAAIAMAISFGEFGATSFIARTDTPTMPIAIAKLLGRPGASNRAAAFGLATLLIVIVCGLIGAVSTRRASNETVL